MNERDDQAAGAEFEERVAGWLEHRGRADEGGLAAVRATIGVLPPRPRARRGPAWLSLAAAVVVVAVIAGVALNGRFGMASASATPSAQAAETSTDPAAWSGDPRFTACADGHVAEPAMVFEMAHAQWFPLHFPGWSRGAPELEVDDPALVVVGREQHWPTTGGPPPPGRTIDPDANLGYQMCIAVGTPSDASVHDYGVTHFDRIVPILSATDLARAAHLDPEVLADPAAWRFPERLTPCGAPTSTSRYIFEIAQLRDFRRSFPNATSLRAFDDAASADEPGLVVVYRDPLPNLRRSASSRAGAPGIHDICVTFLGPAGDARAAILPEVDIEGFHVRLDSPEPTPVPSPDLEPSASPLTTPAVTPIPGPAWAGDARAAITCVGEAANLPTREIPGTNANTFSSPEEGLVYYLEAARTGGDPIPLASFGADDASAEARLFTHEVSSTAKAAVVVSARMVGADRVWMVTSAAACPIDELDPSVPTGRDSFGIWHDADGAPVPVSILTGIADCYNGTQVRYRNHLYVRIPGGGVDPAQLEMTWSRNATLPDATVDTGYRSGDLRLFSRDDGKALYVVDGDRVERLPHVIGDEVQRTDCN